jgi:hypothetical protein
MHETKLFLGLMVPSLVSALVSVPFGAAQATFLGLGPLVSGRDPLRATPSGSPPEFENRRRETYREFESLLLRQ